ncbi:MAG: MFS transporter [Spirochaetales bacterium]|nr:MFS transporter [Spirochaetales bacterium]
MRKLKHNIPYKWLVMVVASMGTLMSTVDMGGVRVILPHLEQVFQTSPDVVVWVSLIWVLVGSSLMLSLARVVDIVGRKRLYVLGFAIFVLGLALCSVSGSITQLIMSRLVQSLGAAMTIAIEYSIVTAAFPPAERGKALGIMGAVAGLGLLGGPAFGGLCLDLLGWQSFFYLRIPFVVITLIMALVLLQRDTTRESKAKFDLPGAVIFFFSLSSLLFVLTQGRRLGWGSPWILGLSCTGTLLLISFIIVEKKRAQPVLDLQIFRNRLFNIAVLSHIILYISTNAVNFALPFYLIDGLEFSASTAGLLLVTIPAFTLLFSPLSGRLSDKLGTLVLCAAGLVLTSLGLYLLYRVSSDTSVGGIIFYSIIIGTGMGFFVSPNTSAIIGAVPAEDLDSASAMAGTLRHLGMSIGLAVSGSIFAIGRSSSASALVAEGRPADIVEKLSTVAGFQDTMLVALIIAAAGIIITVFRGSMRRMTQR